MECTQLPSPLQKLLQQVPYATIATVGADGKPWCSPVVAFWDAHLTLYWASAIGSQHSQNIEGNPAIFVVIYDSGAPLGQGEGLYLQMRARCLTRRADVAAGLRIYTDRYGEDTHHTPFWGSCPRRLYEAVPLRTWSNTNSTQGAHFVDARRLLAQA